MLFFLSLFPPLSLRSEKGAGFEVSGQREAERGASSSVWRDREDKFTYALEDEWIL